MDLSKYIEPEVLNLLSLEEQLQLEVLYDPKKWAAEYLGWIPRDYQEELFDVLLDNKQIVLRWGRRLGKTDGMCIAAAYYAHTQFNIDPVKGSYRVLFICPYENQIDVIFDRLKVIIENSPKLADSVTFYHHKFIFANGSIIVGKTAGSKSNKGAVSLRGQGADVIIFDEVDYMNDKEIMNVLQLKKEDPGRIRVMAASTPTGNRNLYYKWCTEGAKLGWKHIHITSLVSKEIHDVNPDNQLGLTYLEELTQQLTQLEYLHEVMAEFGDNQMSLFQKRFIDKAIEIGRDIDWKYDNFSTEPRPKMGPRILGVDWDKSSASTNMLIIEYNKHTHRFYIIQRVEIPSHEFTYIEAVNKIIFLNQRYDLDWIYVDRGYGETQIEYLRMEGIKRPETGLAEKVVGIQFSQKIECRDPYTKLKVKKDVKPFMVNNAVNIFEKEAIVLNPTDNKVITQLQDYCIKKVSPSGRPSYTEVEEHIVDCIGLALLGFEQQYGKLFNLALSVRIVGLMKNTGDDMAHIKDARTKPRIISLLGNDSYVKPNRRNENTRITTRRRF